VAHHWRPDRSTIPEVTHEELVNRSFEARRAAWSTWGAVDENVLTHIISPMFMGGPVWPNTRQAFIVARRPGELLVASDGLSDPFEDDDEDDRQQNGLEHEFFATTKDPLDKIPGSWLWDLVWQMSQFAASRDDLAALLDELTLISTELYNVDIPDPYRNTFVNEDDRVGVLLGLTDSVPPARVSGPLSAIRLVDIKLLTLAELEYVVENGEAGRQELQRRFAEQGALLTSSLDRASVV
jgi:hypothetical protein